MVYASSSTAPCPVGSGHVSGRRCTPERNRVSGSVPYFRKPCPGAGQFEGVGHAEARCGSIAEKMRSPIRYDRWPSRLVQAAQPALLQPLTGEQQVYVERPTDPAYLDEGVDEVRLRREKFAELVADHRCSRLAVRWPGAQTGNPGLRTEPSLMRLRAGRP